MGKITSLIEFEGKIGNLVGYKGKDGRNVLRHEPYSKFDARTSAQMLNRVRWANMIAMWRAMNAEDKPSFEGKKAGWSDFNAFVSVNKAIANVALTRDEAKLKCGLVAPLFITSGSLPSVNITSVSGGKMKSDISLGDLVIDSETRVGAFSTAVLDENPNFAEGDRIVVFLFEQTLVDNLPKINCRAAGIDLDPRSSKILLDEVPEALFSTADGYLGSKSTVNGGYTVVHTRKDTVTGEVLVSRQKLVVNNMMLSNYTSKSKTLEAVESYGGVRYRGILTPGGDPLNDWEESVTP